MFLVLLNVLWCLEHLDFVGNRAFSFLLLKKEERQSLLNSEFLTEKIIPLLIKYQAFRLFKFFLSCLLLLQAKTISSGNKQSKK